jgi:hypothetical protein
MKVDEIGLKSDIKEKVIETEKTLIDFFHIHNAYGRCAERHISQQGRVSNLNRPLLDSA